MTLPIHNFSNDQHGWAELLPTRECKKPLTGQHRYPWVIIGAGLTGLSCARQLAKLNPNDQILLLDARLVGQAASGRNSGFAVAVSHFSGKFDASKKENYVRTNRINQAGLGMLRSVVKKHSIDCQWDENGFYHTAADIFAGKEMAYFLRHLQELGIDHTPLKQQELQHQLGTSLYKSGVHVPCGALIQPAALVRGLANTLPSNVILREQNPVLKIETGNTITLRLENASVKTDKVILAVNHEIGRLGFLRRRISATTLSGSFTRVLSQQEIESLGSKQQWGALSLHSGGATVRLTQDGRICLRNTVEYYGGKLLSEAMLAKRQAIHRSSFENRFPQLAHVPFEFSWSGVEGISRNGTNFFKQLNDNIYFAGGYNGSGVSKGTAFGAALAQYASNEQSNLISDCLSSAGAQYIPPRPFLDIGAALTIGRRFRGIGLDR